MHIRFSRMPPPLLHDAEARRHARQTRAGEGHMQTPSDRMSAKSAEGCRQSHVRECGLETILRCFLPCLNRWIICSLGISQKQPWHPASCRFATAAPKCLIGVASRVHQPENKAHVQLSNAGTAVNFCFKCCICSLKIDYLLCLRPKYMKTARVNKKTVQLNNNSPAVPLCRIYRQLIQLETTAASKFCGGRFSQGVDLKPHSWAPSASTPRGRVISVSCSYCHTSTIKTWKTESILSNKKILQKREWHLFLFLQWFNPKQSIRWVSQLLLKNTQSRT